MDPAPIQKQLAGCNVGSFSPNSEANASTAIADARPTRTTRVYYEMARRSSSKT